MQKLLSILFGSILAHISEGADGTGFLPESMFDEDESASAPPVPATPTTTSGNDEPLLDFNYNVVADKLLAQSKTEFHMTQEGRFKFFQTEDCLEVIEEESPFGYRSNCWVQNPAAPCKCRFIRVARFDLLTSVAIT